MVPQMTSSRARFDETVRSLVVCPQCRQPFDRDGESLRCRGCGFEGAVSDEVVIMGRVAPASYFDDKYEVMQAGHVDGRGDFEFAYRQQVALLDTHLKTGSTLLDVGCGSALCYKKPAGSFLVGLEYSLPSIRSNQDVDLRICGSAVSLPLRDGAVDVGICFYSMHHMVGETVRESRAMLEKAFEELARVLKPGGRLLVFEMRPWWPFRVAQSLCWDVARRALGAKLDMHMWPQAAIEPPGRGRVPGARFEARVFKASPLQMFPPVFALPWLKVPRAIYPLSPVAYVWSKP